MDAWIHVTRRSVLLGMDARIHVTRRFVLLPREIAKRSGGDSPPEDGEARCFGIRAWMLGFTSLVDPFCWAWMLGFTSLVDPFCCPREIAKRSSGDSPPEDGEARCFGIQAWMLGFTSLVDPFCWAWMLGPTSLFDPFCWAWMRGCTSLVYSVGLVLVDLFCWAWMAGCTSLVRSFTTKASSR
jgi:hypothetical protein